jgi:ATP adenylyltransferase
VDHLWSPWRYQYVTKGDQPPGCIFCTKPAEGDDAKHFILHRGRYCFVLLNLYPYASGHLMVAPFAHVSTLEQCPEEAYLEMALLGRRAEAILREVYRCEGLNLGFNIGKCAGAGVAGHIHLHVLPRWTGDANFMSTLAETRVLPEELSETYRKLSAADWAGVKIRQLS